MTDEKQQSKNDSLLSSASSFFPNDGGKDPKNAVEKRAKEVAEFLKSTAAQGYCESQNHLGNLYKEGIGLFPKDPNEARRYYRLAAAQGHKGAKKALQELEEPGQSYIPL